MIFYQKNEVFSNFRICFLLFLEFVFLQFAFLQILIFFLVRRAMNDIVASQKERDAQITRADADKIARYFLFHFPFEKNSNNLSLNLSFLLRSLLILFTVFYSLFSLSSFRGFRNF